MVSQWPVFKEEWSFEKEEHAVETMKEAVRAIRNVRTSMNVPPSKKAKVYVVSENEELLQIFEHSKVFFATLGYASEVFLQKDKTGIAEDAVSVVIPQAYCERDRAVGERRGETDQGAGACQWHAG